MSVKEAKSPPSSPPVGPRIRNKGIRKVRVGDLLEAEWNPATHSDFQGECLDGSIAEIGFIGYPDVFELPDGTLKLWDGHLRKSRLVAVYGADAEIEVAVCDLSEPEAKKAALLKDPIAAMREHDAAKLDELLREVETGSEALAKMMDELAQENGIVPGEEDVSDGGYKDIELGEAWQVVVQCKSEDEQREVYEHMTGEGFKCRLLTL